MSASRAGAVARADAPAATTSSVPASHGGGATRAEVSRASAPTSRVRGAATVGIPAGASAAPSTPAVPSTDPGAPTAPATDPGAPTPPSTDPAAPSPDPVVSAPDRWRPTRRDSRIAVPVRAVTVRSEPGGAPIGRVSPFAPWGGGPTGLMVLARRIDPNGRAWLRVRLAERPNAAAGWIPADVARVRRTLWRIVVSTRGRELRVLRRGRVVRRGSVVIGAPSTPTPHGRFAVVERVRQPAGGFLGDWALHLTAHSTVLENYGGGPGRVALHGRGGASLLDPLGTARSHGCVRLDDRLITLLARVARPGTPVTIRR